MDKLPMEDKDKPAPNKEILSEMLTDFVRVIMIIFQLLGCMGLLLYSFLSYESLDEAFQDDRGDIYYALIQLAAVVISFYSWKFFKQKRLLIAFLLSLVTMISLVATFYDLVNSISYN